MAAKNQADLIKEYLDRIRARDKSVDLQQYADRLIHLSGLKSLLGDLSKSGFVVEEGPTVLGLADTPEGQLGVPDFVVLKEDVLFYVYLLVDPPGRLSHDQAKGIFEALRQNLTLSAVILVWPSNDYASLVVDSFSIRSYLEREDPIDLSSEALTPVRKAIEQAYGVQFVNWQCSADLQRLRAVSRPMAHFSDALRGAVENVLRSERSRTLHVQEKVAAQQLVSDEDVARLVESIVAVLSREKETMDRGSVAELNSAMSCIAET